LPAAERQRLRGGGAGSCRELPGHPGEPKLYVKTGDSGNQVTRAFCPECGCMLFLQVSARPDLVGIRVGTLDDPSWFRLEADIFVKSAQPWDHMNPDLPKYATYPPGKAYEPSG
jgi:hypothetical protein